MKKMWLGLVTVLVLLATACGGGGGGGESTSGGPSGSAGGGPVEIVFWHGNSGQAGLECTKLVKQWNAANPDIQVKAVFYGSSDRALTKVETAVASGTYPDIAYLYGSWAANIATSPALLPLNDYIQNDPTFNWDDFWPAERYAATVDGKIIGIPALVDNLAIVYNPALFDAAGIQYPTPEWTWDDFRAAAKAMTDPANQQFGWAYPADASEDTVWHWEAMLWEAGGDILNADNTQAVFNSPQGVQALTVLQDMATVDHSIYIDTTNTKIGDVFNGGKIGMLVTGPWDLQGFKNVDYGVQIMPSFDDPSNHQTISGPDNWVLFNNGPERAQAAFEFIKWYTEPDQDIQNALYTATLPIRQSELDVAGYQTFLDKYPGIQTFVENEQNALKARPVTPKYPMVSEALGQAIVSVLLGKADAQTALDQAAQAANAALAAP
jgi:multiple sugar transport system substrate-binding protein